MLTDEVDAAWRCINVAGLAVEVLNEAASHKINVHHMI